MQGVAKAVLYRRRKAALGLGTVSLAALAAGAVRAQTASPSAPNPSPPGSSATVAEVVVTAQRRTENLQDVPLAVTALGAQALRDQSIREARDLQNVVPGLSFRSGAAASTAEIFIRGVGTADFNANNVGAVGVYVDDVFIGANSAKLFNVFDSAGVEVLRGPQGTLYGRNTTGGAIKFASHLPDSTPSGDLSLSYGRFNDVRVEGGFGGPIVEDKLKVRVSGFYERNDGTTLNVFTGHRVNVLDIWAGRAIVDYTPTNDFLVRLTVHGGDNEGGARQFTHRGYLDGSTDLLGYADNDGDPWRGSYDIEGKAKIKVFGASLKVEKTLSWAVLTSISAYEKVDHTTLEDTDASPNDLVTAIYDDHPRQWTQELRLESRPGHPWDWAVGAYYFHDDLSSNSSFDLLRSLRDPTAPMDGFDPANSIGLLRYPFQQTTQSGAVFLQGDYRLTPKLKLTAGVRYTADSIDFDARSFFDEQGFIVPVVSADERKAFGNVSYRVAADYDLARDLHAYASISTGYNSGGYSGGAATDPAQLLPYRAESLTAYEGGLKAELFSHRLRINTAVFFYDYSDLQVFIFDTSGPVPVQRKTNAGSATLYGAETEVTARPTPDLTLFVSASALHSEYQDFSDGSGDYAGHDLVDAPRLSGSIGASYTTTSAESGG